MRDILEKLKNIENSDYYRRESSKLVEKIIYDDDKVKEWLDYCTDIMRQRIENGEYPVDVINDLAREYASFFDNSYDSFCFARDALDHRAWELGLRYTHDEDDDSVYNDIKRFAGIKSTKDNKEKEKITEQNWKEKLKNIFDPAKIEQKAVEIETKRLSTDLWNKFMFFVKKNNMTNKINIKLARDFLESEEKLHTDFLDHYMNKYIREGNLSRDEISGFLPENVETTKNFIKKISGEIAKRGGLRKVRIHSYDKNKDIFVSQELQQQLPQQIPNVSGELVEKIKKYTTPEERKQFTAMQLYILMKRRSQLEEALKLTILSNPSCMNSFNLEFAGDVLRCAGTVMKKEVNEEKFDDSAFNSCIESLKKCIL